MRNNAFALLVPAALLLSACTTVEPVIKDNGPRTASCAYGGPDSVAQQFY
ncbi:lipoprotein, partial [Serratia bockelmannii]|nr:lipoprotein [Serratia bockelmannii]